METTVNQDVSVNGLRMEGDIKFNIPRRGPICQQLSRSLQVSLVVLINPGAGGYVLSLLENY